MKFLASKCSTLALFLCLDRAITNYCFTQYLYSLFTDGPINVSFHHEPCNSHGCALVKGKWTTAKKSAAALNSVSRFLRDGKQCEQFEECVDELITADEVEAIPHVRPMWHVLWAETLTAAVMGFDYNTRMRTKNKNGSKKSSYLIAVETFLEHVGLKAVCALSEDEEGIRPTKVWVVWNCAILSGVQNLLL